MCRNGETCDCVHPYLDDARCTEANWCQLEDSVIDCFEGECVSHTTGWLPPDTLVSGGKPTARCCDDIRSL